jgi:hypothetical protein
MHERVYLQGSPAKESRREVVPTAKLKKTAWPKTIAEGTTAVETSLGSAACPITSAELTTQFGRTTEPEVREILGTLVALARAYPGDIEGRPFR